MPDASSCWWCWQTVIPHCNAPCQILHSWGVEHRIGHTLKCLFRLKFRLNLLLQRWQTNGCASSWIACWGKITSQENMFSIHRPCQPCYVDLQSASVMSIEWKKRVYFNSSSLPSHACLGHCSEQIRANRTGNYNSSYELSSRIGSDGLIPERTEDGALTAPSN